MSHDKPVRRGSPRAPIELKIEYRQMNAFFADYTRNISKGGAFIKTNKPLPVGTRFIFTLVLPEQKQPFQLCGEVRWVQDENSQEQPDEESAPDLLPSSSQPGMGIRFIFDQPEQRAAFEKAVEQLMVGSLGQHLYEQLVKRESGGSFDDARQT